MPTSPPNTELKKSIGPGSAAPDPDNASPATQEPEPLNILRIEPQLVRISRSRDEVLVRIRELLIYLTELTSAHSSYLIDPNAPENSRLLGRIWKDSSPPTQEAIAEMMRYVSPSSTPTPGPAASVSISVAATNANGALQPYTDGRESPNAVVKELQSMPGLYLVASPISRPGKSPYFVCLLLNATRTSQLEPFLIILQTSTGFIHSVLGEGEEKVRADWALKQAAALVELGALAAKADGFYLALNVLADRLRTHLGCALVAVGVAKSTRRVKVASISGAGNFDKLGASASLLQGAMRESLARGESIVRHLSAVDGVSSKGLGEVAHQELLRALDWATVVSIPLYRRPEADASEPTEEVEKGEPLAVFLFAWEKPQGYNDQARQFLVAAQPYLESQLILLKKADPVAPLRWIGRAWENAGRVLRLLIVLLLGGLAILLATPFPHYMWVSCRVQPELKRVVAAPFEGRLKEARVEPGDLVQAGDVLAVMDDKELRWKEAESIAARDRSLTLRDKNMADREATHAAAVMAGLEAEQHKVDLSVTQYKIANLELKSPVAGVVLAGDLKRAEGVPLSKGQVMFEVAPLDKLVLELDIPDSDIPYTSHDMPITARLEAFPGDTWTLKLHKVNPQAEVRDGEHVFVSEANLPEGEISKKLRPGMKGWAVLEGAPQPLWWQLTHKAWDYIRLTFFW
ncbi:MAG: efflux RND transporter periplasmic adaptor subunit [Candidatus Methylacidiphilales bacterium]|nr:efflux RND transporter periplasmic adaptor subunit [Candidatus Methylacidiphilales bacterium]